MRLGKHVTGRPDKSNLVVEFRSQLITSYAGLELIRRFLAEVNLTRRLREALRGFGLRGDYGPVVIIRVMLALWLTGGRRLSDLRWVADDPMVLRFCEVRSFPDERTVSRGLGAFRSDSQQALIGVNTEVVIEQLRCLNLKRVTLDIDGTVVSCGDTVGGAMRGYNPHNRHAKSYFPLLCHIAQTGHFLRVRNRPGNVHDGYCGAAKLIGECIDLIRKTLPKSKIEIRLDSAFFTEEILNLLNDSGVEYAIKVPLWKWLELKPEINARKRWRKTSDSLCWFRHKWKVPRWEIDTHLIVYRQKLSSKGRAKTFQLDLFTPDDGIYEYHVLVTNKVKALKAENVLAFYNGRCAMEKQIAELKNEFGFDAVLTHNYSANSTCLQISILTYNLIRNFQYQTGQAEPRKQSVRHTFTHRIQSLRTLRFRLISSAGRIVRRRRLQLNSNPKREVLWREVEHHLAHAA